MAPYVRTPEVKAKQRAAMIGKRASPETRAKLSAMRKGHLVKPEVRAKIKAKLSVYWGTPEARANVSAKLTGRKKTPEHLAKLGAAFRGRKLSKEHRDKVVAALRAAGPPRPVWKNTELEARLWVFLVNAGFTIELEKRFGRYRVDVYLPEYHLAFEADGWWHGRPGRSEADALRDAELLERYALPVVRLVEKDLVELR